MKENSPFHVCCQYGHEELVQYFIKREEVRHIITIVSVRYDLQTRISPSNSSRSASSTPGTWRAAPLCTQVRPSESRSDTKASIATNSDALYFARHSRRRWLLQRLQDANEGAAGPFYDQ